MSTNGIDVSQYQAGLKLSSISGLDFTIAKASQGLTSGGGFADPHYKDFEHQANAIPGLHFGAYHFGRPEYLNARAQADYFCATAQPRSGMSLWYDYETWGVSGQYDAEEIGYFISEIKRNHGNKPKVGIYTNGEGLARIKPYLFEIPYNGLWFANPSVPMTTQNPSLAWQVHQYEVFGGIDRNYSVWSRADWESYWAW